LPFFRAVLHFDKYFKRDIMSANLFLRPLGLLYGRTARDAMAAGSALPLAGGPIAFTAVELIEGEPGHAKRVIARTATIEAMARDELAIRAPLDRICTARAAIAGLTLDRPRIMGIVNVTPDSFSDGGQYADADSAVQHAKRLHSEGADILDVGGESTRPGAVTIAEDEEVARVLPVLERLKGSGALISIDTRKPGIMRLSAQAGVHMLNDVSGLTFAADSLTTAAQLGLPVIIMHAQGNPQTMQDNPNYKDVVLEVYAFLAERIEAAVAAGLPRDKIMADPGIGFGKSTDHNLALLAGLSLFHSLGVPLLVGASRKGFIRDTASLGGEPNARVPGSIAAALWAIAQGVQAVRVHDVLATCQAIFVWQAVQS
jgi:dihydropteroate synthase